MTTPLGAQSGVDPAAQSGSLGEGGAGTGAPAGAQSGAVTSSGDGTANSGQSATVALAEYDRLKAMLAQSDRRATENEAKLRQLVDKDLPEIDKLRRDKDDTDKALAAAKAQLDAMRIENAFLTDNTLKWRNPASALRLLDRSKITVDSDGNVAGMKAALEALAKSDAYLLEPAEAAEGDAGKTAAPLGTPPANSGLNAPGKAPVGALAARLPAMRTRLGA